MSKKFTKLVRGKKTQTQPKLKTHSKSHRAVILQFLHFPSGTQASPELGTATCSLHFICTCLGGSFGDFIQHPLHVVGHSQGHSCDLCVHQCQYPSPAGAQVFTKTLHAVSCGMKGTVAQPSVSFAATAKEADTVPCMYPLGNSTAPTATSQDRRAAAHLESFTDAPIIVHHFILPRLSFGALQNTRSSARVGIALPSGCSQLWFTLEKGAQRGPFHECPVFLLKKASAV